MADALRARIELPRITTGDDGAEIMEDQRGARPPKFDDAETRLQAMDARGIDIAVLSMLGGYG